MKFDRGGVLFCAEGDLDHGLLTYNFSKVEPSSVTVTSARPSAEAASLPSDESLRKDIPIPAKNLTADEIEEPIATVVKTEGVKAEIESKLLNLPSRFTIVKSDEDKKRKFILGYIAGANVRRHARRLLVRSPRAAHVYLVVHLPVSCDQVVLFGVKMWIMCHGTRITCFCLVGLWSP